MFKTSVTLLKYHSDQKKLNLQDITISFLIISSFREMHSGNFLLTPMIKRNNK